MANVMLTRAGLQYVLSAHDNGVYVDVRYFIPVYDDRIDSTLRYTGGLSSMAQIADETATEPYGEKIWNISGYSLSDTDDYVISAVTFSDNRLIGSYQNHQVYTNLYDSVPLSTQISGTAFAVSAGSPAGYYDWTVTGGGVVTGNNDRPTSANDDYFVVTDYYPVYDSAAEERLRGVFKAEINKRMGKFKFNKIAMYAVQVDSNGVVLGSCFFGEAYLDTPVVKTELATDGFDNFIFDIQIDLSGTSATWNDVFFSSSADYWSHSPGGLYYSGRIGVGNFAGDVREISATAHLRKARDTSGTVDNNIPTLRLDYDDTRFVSMDVVSGGYFVSGTNGGDLVIQVSDWSTYCGETIAIRPKVARTIALGTTTYPYERVALNDNRLHAIDVNNGQVKIGKLNGYSESDYYGIPSIYLSDLAVEITATSDGSTGSDINGAYIGGDLFRKYQNLFIFTTFYCNTGNEYYDRDIAIVAGLDASGTYSAVGTPSAKINHMSLTRQLLNSQNFSSNVASAAEIHLAAKGGIKLHGVLELENIRNSYVTDSVTYTPNNAMIISKQNNLLLVAGLNSLVDYDTLNTYFATRSEYMSSWLTSTSQLLLMGKTISTIGNIKPWITNTDDIGSLSLKYKGLYVENARVTALTVNTIGVTQLGASEITATNLTATNLVTTNGFRMLSTDTPLKYYVKNVMLGTLVANTNTLVDTITGLGSMNIFGYNITILDGVKYFPPGYETSDHPLIYSYSTFINQAVGGETTYINIIPKATTFSNCPCYIVIFYQTATG
ncbi:MAG: hypothetical protein PHF86_09270 [Candidatus Nanoarchaeia archaeon]|nr:hypothetical protein [Candidatus Nanoarchaeia archaeon]